MKKVFIAIPCLDMVDIDFVKSLINLKVKDFEISTNFVCGSLVYAAREELAEKALESGADYVLWLDSDMVFPPETLIDLLKDDKDIVTGLCFRRKPPYTPCIYEKIRMGMTPKETEVVEYIDYPKDKLFEIDACGFACVLMKAEILRLCFNNFSATFMPIPGFGEDISLCLRAKKLGYKIWCDSRTKIGHIGKAIVDEPTFERVKNGK